MNNYFELTNQFEIIDENYITTDGTKGKKIRDTKTNDMLFISNDVDIIVVGEYKEEKHYKNRRELLQQFEQILPFTTNRLLQITYYKQPNYKELYKGERFFKSQKAYEFAHRYGERRIMKGSFVVKNNTFKEKDGYLIMKDIEDNNIEKPIIVRNMISFTFDGIKHYIDEK